MKLYPQELRAGTYQMLLPLMAIETHMPRFFPVTYGDCYLLCHDGMVTVLLREEGMKDVAQAFEREAGAGFSNEWQTRWHDIDQRLTESSRDISQAPIDSWSGEQLWECYQSHFEYHQSMWGASLFIDALDLGWDQDQIERRRVEYGFTQDEVQVLLAPCEQSFMTDLDREAVRVVDGEETEEDFRQHFWWVGTNYSEYAEVGRTWIEERAAQAHVEPFINLTSQQQAVLKAHGLMQNPFGVFQTLVIWRDDRKRLNYVGLYGLSRLVSEGLRRRGLDLGLRNQLFPDEVRGLFLGDLDVNHLERRVRETVLGSLVSNKIEILEGEAADRAYASLKAYLPSVTDALTCKGMVACRGYMQGKVRCIPSADSLAAKLFQKGEVLVTGMTRPEFLPLMKKAGAIVTDEGGISCHAAIVSRELNIPCIIGTKVATKMFKDGDLVEVDAEKGIVRKVH